MDLEERIPFLGTAVGCCEKERCFELDGHDYISYLCKCFEQTSSDDMLENSEGGGLVERVGAPDNSDEEGFGLLEAF